VVDWTPAHTRGAKLIVELLRDRWRHATMYALHDGPLQPHAVMEVFQQAAPRNLPAFGTHTVYRECVVRHLSDLLKADLVGRRNDRGVSAETYYHLNALGAGLLDAIGPAAEFGLSQYPQLVAMSRAARRLPPGPVDDLDAAALAGPARTFALRRCAAILFGVLLAKPWTLAVLAGLSAEPLGTTALTAEVNAVIAANRDILLTDFISRATVHAQLARLDRFGYVEQAPKRRHTVTALGRQLTGSLIPAAEFGIVHDAQLTAAVRALHRAMRPGDAKDGTSAANPSTVPP
jgi:DNA-binding HxlR family transcriptional regulator